jgi:lipoic acid synthetase
LKEVKRLYPEATTKSGLMVGLGERQEEVSSLLRDLRKAYCDLVTIGQYLRPSRDHHPVVDYIHPELFQANQKEAEELGFSGVASGPYVRSSYKAEKLYRRAKGISGAEA